LTDASRWIEPVAGLPFLTSGSSLVIFFSGVYLAIRMSAFEAAWPKVTMGPCADRAAGRTDWQAHAR
jgi:hypothetical protein